MNRHYLAMLAFLISVSLSSCQLDPWVTGDSPTDKVAVTKITHYGKMQDGVTPMKSEMGKVIFSHKTHADQNLACVDCHHKKNNDDRIKKCAACHVGNDGFEIMHGLCLDCHMSRGGPEKCTQCH